MEMSLKVLMLYPSEAVTPIGRPCAQKENGVEIQSCRFVYIFSRKIFISVWLQSRVGWWYISVTQICASGLWGVYVCWWGNRTISCPVRRLIIQTKCLSAPVPPLQCHKHLVNSLLVQVDAKTSSKKYEYRHQRNSYYDGDFLKIIIHKKQIHAYIARHTGHTIVSWPNPKQWLIFHNSYFILERVKHA